MTCTDCTAHIFFYHALVVLAAMKVARGLVGVKLRFQALPCFPLSVSVPLAKCMLSRVVPQSCPRLAFTIILYSPYITLAESHGSSRRQYAYAKCRQNTSREIGRIYRPLDHLFVYLKGYSPFALSTKAPIIAPDSPPLGISTLLISRHRARDGNFWQRAISNIRQRGRPATFSVLSWGPGCVCM